MGSATLSDQTNITGTNAIDSQQLSELVKDISIACRNVRSYPKGHPVIQSAIRKAADTYENLLARCQKLTITVSRDALSVNDSVLDKRNMVLGEFARQLYDRGILALHLNHGVKPHELNNFAIILNLKREDILRQGGIKALWEKAAISTISITPIRYDGIKTTEVDRIDGDTTRQSGQEIWQSFIRKLISETTETWGPNGLSDENSDPELLAKIVNQIFARKNNSHLPDFSRSIRAFEPYQPATSSPNTDMPIDKLSRFVSNLHPELRRQLLENSFDISSISGQSLGEDIIPRLTDQAASETLEDIRVKKLQAPPTILALVRKLDLQARENTAASAARTQEEEQVNDRIRHIFLEHDAENFTPQSYQTILDRIVTTDNTLRIEQGVLAELMATMENEAVEAHISDIIMCMLHNADDQEQLDLLVNNLSEVFGYILQTGDYQQLLRLFNLCDTMPLSETIRQELRSRYTSYEYLEEMLVGLHIWGKAKYEIIASLIKVVGHPFIEVLLDRLAVEDSLSLRRFLIDRIQEFGTDARDAVIARLSDKRWFVLRNLIAICHALNDSSVLEHIRPLINNPNSKVRQEALRTCLHFQDPVAERQLLYDMGSQDHEIQQAAIALAGKSRSVDIYKRLISITSKPGLGSTDLDLKCAAIKALAEIGRAETIPELSAILSSSSFLNSRQLTRLKLDVIRSLQLYPREQALPLLQKYARGNGELPELASTVLKLIQGKPS